MNFNFSHQAEKFRSELREFVKNELPEDYISLYGDDEHYDDHWALAMKTARKLGQKGWLTVSWPKEYGGMGATFEEQVVFNYEVGYWGIPGAGMGIGGTAWVGPTLMIYGSDEQKKKHLPDIASGSEDGVWCTGYSEPDSGSDLASLQTYAQRQGDKYLLNGQKIWTSAAHRSRWCWLAARTDREAPKKHHGISLFILDMNSPGVEVKPVINILGHHHFNEIFMNNVELGQENLVGAEGQGWEVIMKALSFERSIGVRYGAKLKRILDELKRFAIQHNLLGNAYIKHSLVTLDLEIEALILCSCETAWKISRGERIIYEPSRDKANLDGLVKRLATFGTEMIGPYSQMLPSNRKSRWRKLKGVVENLYWSGPAINTAGGTTNTMRNIVAKYGLRVSAE
ncbi:MAG: acyl-CoA dehydrogenase family protein [Proteobacteria bacterium]|nr:acyl-CoA dehydrogenase family protein [Pseudomonadota bacterium]